MSTSFCLFQSRRSSCIPMLPWQRRVILYSDDHQHFWQSSGFQSKFPAPRLARDWEQIPRPEYSERYLMTLLGSATNTAQIPNKAIGIKWIPNFVLFAAHYNKSIYYHWTRLFYSHTESETAIWGEQKRTPTRQSLHKVINGAFAYPYFRPLVL